MFAKVLVANRGAVAARVIRALREMRIASVAVYSDADRDNPYVAEADDAYHIGPEAAGIRFIGPRPDMIEAMGHKTQARDLVRRYGMPMTAGSEVLPADPAVIAAAAERIGYPVIVKPAAGGGGIGMIAALNPQELQSAVEKAASMAARAFGNGEVYIERLIDRPRHIEIQVLGDRTGKVRHLFERDCSIQRRHQKVIEEARAPGLAQDDADRLGTQIAETLTQIGYDNIGTVEMLPMANSISSR